MRNSSASIPRNTAAAISDTGIPDAMTLPIDAWTPRGPPYAAPRRSSERHRSWDAARDGGHVTDREETGRPGRETPDAQPPAGRRVRLPGRGTTNVWDVPGPPGAPTVV